MANSEDGARQPWFLPDSVKLFLRQRLEELLGSGFIFAAILLTVALLSFDVGDPSLNQANGGTANNWLGLPGAFASDFLLQALGVVAGLPALVLACWGWRLISHQRLPHFWFNLTFAPIAVIVGALFAATFEAAGGWPLTTGFGGVLGDFMLHHLTQLLAGLPWTTPLTLVTVLSGIFAGFTTLAAIAISFLEWRKLGQGSAWLFDYAGKAVRRSREVIGVLETWRAKWALARASRSDQRGQDLANDDEDDANIDTARQIIRRREPHLRGDDDANESARDNTAAKRDAAKAARVEKARKKLKKSKRAKAEEQPSLDLGGDGDYRLPPLHLLHQPTDKQRLGKINADALEQNARLLESVLDDYGVRGTIVQVRPGPVVTLYELEPAPGTKSSRVIGLADDIARSMSAVSVRVAVVPGRNAIGIELPNQNRETVYLRELLATPEFDSANTALTLALGKDIGGEPVMADLAKMPHLLIAGTTGSGKSVGINTMILSLLYRLSPQQCRLIMIDPKMLELSVYDGIPHLLTPVVTDPAKAVAALKWTVREMETRYKAMAKLGVRNIAGYNQRLRDAAARGEELTRTVQTGFDQDTGDPIMEIETLDFEELPFIVVVVDEMADLMMVAGKEIEATVQRLAQMARAAGIHVILATQRPSVDVITGTIKANFPTRISFQVTSKIDSRTILGEQGSEQLLGQGDMLYMAGGGRITRVHGPFVSDDEVERVVKVLKNQGRPRYLAEVTEVLGDGDGDMAMEGGGSSSGDALFDQAVDIVARHQKASTSFIQRHLKIGYNRAATLIEMMEKEGVIGAANHVGKREVFVREPDEEFS